MGERIMGVKVLSTTSFRPWAQQGRQKAINTTPNHHESRLQSFHIKYIQAESSRLGRHTLECASLARRGTSASFSVGLLRASVYTTLVLQAAENLVITADAAVQAPGAAASSC
jgi:hypothetical protein